MWLLRLNIWLRKKRFLKIIDRGPYLVGFPAMQIMNLWGMFFHPVYVSSLTFSLWVKSCSALCAQLTPVKERFPSLHFRDMRLNLWKMGYPLSFYESIQKNKQIFQYCSQKWFFFLDLNVHYLSKKQPKAYFLSNFM